MISQLSDRLFQERFFLIDNVMFGLVPNISERRMKMTNINFIKTLTAGTVLALVIYPQAWAECPEGQIVGLTTKKCINASGTCGTGCSYTLDIQGNLNITGDGTGIMSQSAFYGNKDIKNVTISGIKSAAGYPTTFYNSGAGGGTITVNEPMELFDVWEGNYSTIEINSSKFVPNYRAFYSSAIQKIIIPDNLTKNFGSLAFTDSGGGGAAFNVDIQCKGNLEKCETILASAKNQLLKNGGTLNVDYWKGYDQDGNWNEWSKKGLTIYNEDMNPIAIYGFDRKLLSSYNYNPDGSTSIYDSNGKLIGIHGKRILTVDEASALVKNNKNTFSIRYK
jgi:hypothetical protein